MINRKALFQCQSTHSQQKQQVRGAVFVMPKGDERKLDTTVNSALPNKDSACQTVLKSGRKK